MVVVARLTAAGADINPRRMQVRPMVNPSPGRAGRLFGLIAHPLAK